MGTDWPPSGDGSQCAKQDRQMGPRGEGGDSLNSSRKRKKKDLARKMSETGFMWARHRCVLRGPKLESAVPAVVRSSSSISVGAFRFGEE